MCRFSERQLKDDQQVFKIRMKCSVWVPVGQGSVEVQDSSSGGLLFHRVNLKSVSNS